MELKTIEVIKPTVSVPFKDRIIATLYYPYMVYHIKVTIRRILGDSSYLHGFVVVDLTRALVFLADSLPKTFTVEVPLNTIIPERIDEDRATKLAKKKMVYVAMRKFKLMLSPKVDVIEKKKVYKQFWLVKLNDKNYIIDSLTGESEEVV